MFLLILEKLFSVSVTVGSKSSAVSYRSVDRGLTCLQRIDAAKIVHWVRCRRQQMRRKAEVTVREWLNKQAQGSHAASLGSVKLN